jgi:hypothetical protein
VNPRKAGVAGAMIGCMPMDSFHHVLEHGIENPSCLLGIASASSSGVKDVCLECGGRANAVFSATPDVNR